MLNKKLYLNEEVFTTEVELKSTRDGFGDAILKLGEDPKVIALCADLKESVRLDKFSLKYPKQYIETGIAEQNMAGIGAGLALSGKIPFICSHAIFSPSRNWDQIRVSICFSNANVKIVGSHSGFSNGRDGGVALALEDISLVRSLPNLRVIQPIDYNQTLKAVEYAYKHSGPVYIRLNKEETPTITTSDTPFDFEKTMTLVEGDAVSLIASGPIAYEALEASKILKTKYKIDAEVIHVHSIKPLDIKGVMETAKKTGKVITVEEHQINGGLGSAVAEVLSEHCPTPLIRVGVNDTFGESGSYKELKDKYKISAHHIVESALRILRQD